MEIDTAVRWQLQQQQQQQVVSGGSLVAVVGNDAVRRLCSQARLSQFYAEYDTEIIIIFITSIARATIISVCDAAMLR